MKDWNDHAEMTALMADVHGEGLDAAHGLLRSLLARPAWHERAACRGVGTDVFYVERGGSTDPAKALCDGCTVWAECLAAATTTASGAARRSSASEGQTLHRVRPRSRCSKRKPPNGKRRHLANPAAPRSLLGQICPTRTRPCWSVGRRVRVRHVRRRRPGRAVFDERERRRRCQRPRPPCRLSTYRGVPVRR
jgi:hypothetical protein